MGWTMNYSGSLTIDPPVSMKLARQIKELGRKTAGGPGSECDFQINEDGDGLKHNGCEKTNDDADWIKFIANLLKEAGHTLNGKIEVTDGETDDDSVGYDIEVEDNVVFLQEYEKKKTTRRPA